MPQKKPNYAPGPGRQPVTSVNLAELARYNASQTPMPWPSLQQVMSPGRFEMDTRNTMTPKDTAPLRKPGAGLATFGADLAQVPLGAGLGFGPAAPPPMAFAPESMGPELGHAPAPPPPQAPGPVQAALQAKLMPMQAQAAQPYREDQGARRTAAYRPQVPPWAAQQQQAAGALRGAQGSGYSPGVMTMQQRQRSMQQADSLGLPREARNALQSRILAGDYEAVDRAAALVSGLENPASMGAKGVSAELARLLLGSEEARRYDAHKAEQQAHYQEVAKRHTEEARVQRVLAQKLGLDPLASQDQIRAARQQAMGAASSKDLQPLAAQGDMAAAQALNGNPGPWASGLGSTGVLGRESAAEKAKLDEAARRDQLLYNTRYVLPKRIEQETARFKESGLDRRAWMKVDPRTGKSSSVSADQIMRSYQTALKVYADVHGDDEGFPNVEAWARQQGITYGPQGYKLGPQAGGDLGTLPAGPEQPASMDWMQPGGSPMDWVQGAMQQTTQQAIQQSAQHHVASLTPEQRAKWDRLTPDQQRALLMQVSGRAQ